MTIPYRQKLWMGQVSSGIHVAVRVGADGMVNGTTTGPAVNIGPDAPLVGCGRTATGTNLPVAVDITGTVLFTT